MPSLDPTITGEAACRCGRSANRVHCPSCGSSNTYALKETHNRLMENGVLQEFTIHRCRKCSMYFDDWKWRNECEAIPYVTARKQRIEHAATIVADTIAELNPLEKAQIEAARDPNAPREERIAGFAALFKNLQKKPADDKAEKLRKLTEDLKK